MRIGYLSTAYHTSHILKHRIKAEWQLFGSGVAIVEALSRGEVDLGYVGLPPAIIGIAKGADIKCVAAGHMEGTVIVGFGMPAGVEEVLSQSSVIATPAKGSIHDIIVRYLLHTHGIHATVKNYTWADMILDDLVDGNVTIAAGTPSLAVLAQEYAGAEVLIPPDRLWKNNPSYGIVVREEFLHTRELKEFLHQHALATELLIRNPEKASRIIAKSIDLLSEDVILKILKLSPRYVAELVPEFIQSTMSFVRAMRRLGYIPRDVSREEIFVVDF